MMRKRIAPDAIFGIAAYIERIRRPCVAELSPPPTGALAWVGGS